MWECGARAADWCGARASLEYASTGSRADYIPSPCHPPWKSFPTVMSISGRVSTSGTTPRSKGGVSLLYSARVRGENAICCGESTRTTHTAAAVTNTKTYISPTPPSRGLWLHPLLQVDLRGGKTYTTGFEVMDDSATLPRACVGQPALLREGPRIPTPPLSRDCSSQFVCPPGRAPPLPSPTPTARPSGYASGKTAEEFGGCVLCQALAVRDPQTGSVEAPSCCFRALLQTKWRNLWPASSFTSLLRIRRCPLVEQR